MPPATTKPAGIKEIAETLGVSIGTVDRALHDRSGVSVKTRKRVLEVARELCYRPNAAARSLKLARHVRLGIFLPQQISSFFDLLRDGIRVTAAKWAAGASVEVEFHSFPRLGEGDIECLEDAEWRTFDGVIFAPGDPRRLRTIFNRNGTELPPVVLIGGEIPRLCRLASVTVDAAVSGSIAADLLGRVLPGRSHVAAIIGDLRIYEHAEKVRGFAGSLATLSPHLALLQPVESHDSAEDAYVAAMALFKRNPDLAGLYITTANSLPVLQAAEEMDILGRLQIITTDLFPELVSMIETNRVLASLYQRPFTQGRIAVELLHQHLTHVNIYSAETRLVPHIVLRSNLELFLSWMQHEETGSLV